MIVAASKAFDNSKIQDTAQGARSTETGMYIQYMRISSIAQHDVKSLGDVLED